MNERLKFVLFIVFSLIVFWFTIILLCLPESEPWPPSIPASHHDGHHQSSKPAIKYRHIEANSHGWGPRAPAGFMQSFRAKPLSLLDTLFYQFNPLADFANLTHQLRSISEKDHRDETLKLSSITGPNEHYVKFRGDRLFAFNLLASNRVGLLRSLPDTRQAKCPRATEPFVASYLSSIVICYYNEAPSALMRTIYSILARTELGMLKEILVVDDFSEPGYDVDQVRPYLEQLGGDLQNSVRFVRTPKREGLIRARLFGASLAKGDVLIFLDSHVEPNDGWLEPLIGAIQENQTTIACPMIDLINAETMLYTASPMVKGGLTWALHFKWISVPANTLKTYDDFVKPIKSPSMAGGLYAIHRDYFNHLGAYDRGMNLWGGENIELSLKVWMCGGQILIMPCSRVGHIFRKTRPYGPAPDEPDSLTYNSHRVARVWLDEYLDKYYELVPQARDLDSGNIGERSELRHNLKCNNFTWYLDNVYPGLKEELVPRTDGVDQNNQVPSGGGKFAQKRPSDVFGSRRLNRSARQLRHPGPHDATSQRLVHQTFGSSHNNEDTLGFENGDRPLGASKHQAAASVERPMRVKAKFQIRLLNSNLCLEPKVGLVTQLKFSRLTLNDCVNARTNHSNSSGANQIWSETESREIRMGRGYCLDIMKNLPLLRKCHGMGSYQAWTYSNQTSGGHIMSYYSSGDLCLAVERIQRGEPVIVAICDKSAHDISAAPQPFDGEAARRGERWQQQQQAQQQQQFLQRTRRRRRHKGSNEASFDGKSGGTWLTGPLGPSQALSQFDGSPLSSSFMMHQMWTLNVISTNPPAD